MLPEAFQAENFAQEWWAELNLHKTKLVLRGSLSQRARQILYVIVFAVSVTACNGPLFFVKNKQGPPAQHVDARADRYGMQRSVVDGGRFRHIVYTGEPAASQRMAANRRDSLHVYIEGDGVAWRNRFLISDDPTSKNVLMLDLMAMDTARTLYVGRPCYLGQSDEPGCSSSLWTYQRFSDAVVDSMAAAIRASAAGSAGGDNSEIVLFGHSGGAALALLIAARLPQVNAVVTVAGNLDVNAWVKHHRYTPLYGSLDPALQPPLPLTIRQLHLLGARDRVIPPKLVTGWIERQPAAKIWQFDSYTHSCCWKRQWHHVLNWVETGVSPVRLRSL